MISNRRNQAEERIAGVKDKVEELLYEGDNKDKIQLYGDVQGLWDMVRRQNLS